MMVIFLTGLVSMILLRTLRADYARYTAVDDDDIEVNTCLQLSAHACWVLYTCAAVCLP